MKITRALLLSSQRQAEAWERPQVGQNIFGMALYETKYRYLVEDRYEGDKLRFTIFLVQRKRDEEGKWYDIVADQAHVEEVFADTGELLAFLQKQQIDFETAWQPVENREE